MSARSTRAPAIARSGWMRRPADSRCSDASSRGCVAVAEDGLDPAVYRAEDLARQAASLEQAQHFSAIDVAAFDVSLTSAVLTYSATCTSAG